MDALISSVAVLGRKYNWKKKYAHRKYSQIYVFRHGHTSFNELHQFCGWRNSKLTSKGKQDAKIIAKKLNLKKIDIAFHSSLSRSCETLHIVMGRHKECKVVLGDDRLIERCYGDLEGKSHAWFVKKYGEKELHRIRRGYSVKPPGGESIKDVEKRVKSFLKDLLFVCCEYKVNVALSVHGNSMRPLRRYFEKLSVKEMMSLENPWDDVFVYKVRV